MANIYDQAVEVARRTMVLFFIVDTSGSILTFAVLLIVKLYNLLANKLLKAIAIGLIAIAAVGIFTASFFAEKSDEPMPRTYTPTLSQVKAAVNEWNKEAPELLENYSTSVRRFGGLLPNTFSQVKEGGRTLRHYRFYDRYYRLYMGKELWVVTEKNTTTIYRIDRKGNKGVYTKGHPDYDRLVELLDIWAFEATLSKQLQLYIDDKSPTENQANESKMILLGLPASFYMTDNIITMYDFNTDTGNRAKVTYGKAVIELPDDLDAYSADPALIGHSYFYTYREGR